MKSFFTIFIQALLIPALLISCLGQIIQEPISNPANYHMKIIPKNPTSADEIKLIVLDDCSYNTLSDITKSGNTITIVKHFNSLMKLPCFMQNDTIHIGKLPQGSYILNYKLLDFAGTPPSTALSLFFTLMVAT